MTGFFDRLRQRKDYEREVKLREGKARIKRAVEKQRAMSKRLWDLARRALLLDDPAQFKQLGVRYLLTLQDIQRQERYLLKLESLEAQVEQARYATDFLEAIKGLTGAVIGLADPKNLAAMQRDVDTAMARAETLSDRMDTLMELANDTILNHADTALSEERLKDIESTMLRDLSRGQETAYDAKIEDALRKIAEQMRQG